MIDYIFYLCVDFLVWLSKSIGVTYEFINIVIFIIGYPLFAFFLLIVIYLQYKKINLLKNIIKTKIKH